MGRKTWESIPPRFRPLKDRTNVVVTRGDPSAVAGPHHTVAASVEHAMQRMASQAGQPPSKAFVIGGAQIYSAALESRDAKRILLTRVLDDFECDTFFPLALGRDGKAEGWERKSKEDLDAWTGESVPEGVQEENGTRYVFEMWERM